jgi:hypothetical protein
MVSVRMKCGRMKCGRKVLRSKDNYLTKGVVKCCRTLAERRHVLCGCPIGVSAVVRLLQAPPEEMRFQKQKQLFVVPGNKTLRDARNHNKLFLFLRTHFLQL